MLASHLRDALEPGVMVGRYRLIGRVGGGMGVVYEAEDTVLNRRVALKTLPGDGNDAAARERLLEEARAAAALSHPNVVTVYDVASSGETDFLVMEFLPQGSVADLLDRCGPLPWQLATSIARQACAGLSAAHAAGIVHRDIKPSNLLVADSDRADGKPAIDDEARHATLQIKISDFGISRAIRRTASGITATIVLGTADYMSPEQCEGEAEPRSDVYSLGAAYFTLLTGRPPYTADHPLQVMFRHCASPIPDPCALQAGLPEGCTAIVRRALAKSARERYQNALQMQADLERLLAGDPIEPCDSRPESRVAIETDTVASDQFAFTQSRNTWRSSLAVKAGAPLAAVCLLAALVCWSLWSRKPTTDGRQVPVVNSALISLPPLPAASSALSVAWRPGTRRLHGELKMAAVSRNGRYLACALDEGTALVWDLEEDERTRWLERPDFEPWVHSVAFTPTEDYVVAGFGNLVQIHNIPTGHYDRLQQLEGEAASVAVSSCGRYLAVAEDCGQFEHGRVWLHRFGQIDEQWKIERSHEFEHPYRLAVRGVAFSPDGRCLAACDIGGNLSVYDVATASNLRLLNMPEPQRMGSYGRCAEFSPNSQVLAAAGDRRVVLWDTDSWQQRVLGEAHQSAITHLTWSRDGRWLITAANDGMLLWDAASGEPRCDRPLDAGQNVRTLLFLGRDDWLLSGTSDKKLLLWNWRQALAAADRPVEKPQ